MIALIIQIIDLLKETVSLLHQVLIVLNAILRILVVVIRKEGSEGGPRLILEELVQLKEVVTRYIAQKLQPEPEQPDRLFDANYAESRIGVGNKTISRLVKDGHLPVICVVNRRRQFRERDIEKCRKLYGRS